MKKLKPYKTYFGGKSAHGAYQNIISHIPRCDVFIDAMVGNGGIVSNLLLPAKTVINDIDKNVIDAFINAGQLDQSVILSNLDYRTIIEEYDFGKNTVFYFDPPYLIGSRKSQRKVYRYEWDDNAHNDFIDCAIEIKSHVLISHYPSELYDKRLADWRTHDFTIQSRGGQRLERLYMNFEVPEILQDYRYIGKDYIDRQRIKRKVERHLKKLKNLEGDERVAVLSALIDEFDCTAERLISKK